MRGQAAFDYIMIAAFSLALVVPVFYYAITYSSESITVAQAQDAVGTIAKVADNTYSLGEGSLTRVQISMPEGVRNVTIGSNSIVFRIRTTSGDSDVVALTKAPVNGTISTSSGSKFVIMNNTGPTIAITEA